jgi:hypothetical protein
MQWRNYFCDDITSGANLWDRNFPHAAIPVNYTSEFQELDKADRVLVFSKTSEAISKFWAPKGRYQVLYGGLTNFRAAVNI